MTGQEAVSAWIWVLALEKKNKDGFGDEQLIVPNYCCYIHVLQQHSSAAWGVLLWLILYYFREEMFLSEALYLKRLGRKEQKRRLNTKQFWKCKPAGLYKCTVLLILKDLLMTGAKPGPLIQSEIQSYHHVLGPSVSSQCMFSSLGIWDHLESRIWRK